MKKNKGGKDAPPAPKQSPSGMAKIWMLVRRRFIVYSLLAGIVLFALCTRSYINNRNISMLNIALNYESAGKGLAPNGTRFNMYDFKSDEVLEQVLEAGALENVTTHDLANCIGLSVRGGGGGENYISSEIFVTADIKPLRKLGVRLDTVSLTTLLAKACRNMFNEKYVSRSDVLIFDYSGVDGYEYQELADYYSMKLDLLNRYVAARVNDYSTFRSSTTGLTFREIQEKISNLKNIKLANMKAYVAQTGVVKNKARYLAKLSYLNYRNDETYRKRLAEYSVRLQNVADYNILQTSIVMVPTYDTDGAFYMSMTKTGIDDVATEAQKWNESAAATLLSVNETDAIIQSVQDSASTADEVETVESMIKDIREELMNLTKLTLLTDGDFISYKMDDYITITQGQLSIIAKTGLTQNVIPAFAFYALLWFLLWRSTIRKEKTVV